MTMDEKKKPRLPEVGEYVRGTGRLVSVEDVTPSPPAKVEDWIFESVEAQVVVQSLTEKVIDEKGTYNEFYGEGTAVTTAIEEARKLAEHFGDGVVLVVVKRTSRHRARPTREENFYAREFMDFKHLDHGCCRGIPEPTEEIVWRSIGGGASPEPPK